LKEGKGGKKMVCLPICASLCKGGKKSIFLFGCLFARGLLKKIEVVFFLNKNIANFEKI
jgi:hypothetical protein